MSTKEITCELVDESDLDTRYLAGRLSPEEAEAFEAHFFGCERCWTLVRQGLAVQSALSDPTLRPANPSPDSYSKRAVRPWWPVAAAAALAGVAFGIWQIGFPSQPSLSRDVFRGGSTALVVAASVDSADVTASWPQVPGTDVYRVRLYSADGLLAMERETPDTTVSLPIDSISRHRGAGMFWQVQALDRIRSSLARSDLTRVVLPNP